MLSGFYVGKIDHREDPKMMEYILKHSKKYNDIKIQWSVEQLQRGDYFIEGVERVILIERKFITDLKSSLYDSRIFKQLKDEIEYKHPKKKTIKLLLISGNWNKLNVNFNKNGKSRTNKYTTFFQMNGIIKNFLKFGIVTITFPDDKTLADFILKVIADRDVDFHDGESIIRQNKDVVNQDKELDRFAISIMALVKGFGKTDARIISKLHQKYSELKMYTALELSNLIRRENGKKEQKKPLDKVEKLMEYI